MYCVFSYVVVVMQLFLTIFLCWKSAENNDKVHIFWEGHKILRNLHQLFVLCTASQIFGGDFAKFCGLLRIYELYTKEGDFVKFCCLLRISKLYYIRVSTTPMSSVQQAVSLHSLSLAPLWAYFALTVRRNIFVYIQQWIQVFPRRPLEVKNAISIFTDLMGWEDTWP